LKDETMKTIALTSIVTLGFCFAPCGATDSYTIAEISIPWNYPQALGGLTERGAIAGTLVNDDDSIAFLNNKSGPQRLGVLDVGSGYFEVRGINRRDEVVGVFTYTNNRPLLWQAGTMQDLGTLGGVHAFATAINDHGDIVGASTLVGDTIWHPFLYRKGVMVDLGASGGDAYAYAINNKRQVVMELQDESGNGLAINDDGDLRIIGAIGAWTTGLAINESGHVVGVCEGVVEPGGHAFYYDGQRLIDLHVAGETSTYSKSINNRDELVGTRGILGFPTPGEGGFLYRDGQRTEIADLLPPGSGWSILTAEYINDAGQIVGVGMHDGAYKFYMLTPIKHPSGGN
jgi:probable HAF family extracellular repeat protein